MGEISMMKIHEEKLAQYKNRFRLCSIIVKLPLLACPILLISLIGWFLSWGKVNFLFLILLVLMGSAAFMLAKYQEKLCEDADRYVSESMFRPIVARDVVISLFETNGVIERQKLENASIFPNYRDYVIGKSHFNGIVNNFQIEYFDFVSYSRYGTYRNISYGRKGHFAILTTDCDVNGYCTIRPSKKSKKAIDKVFDKMLGKETPIKLTTGNKDFDSCYTITTNYPENFEKILTSELIDIFLKHKKDKRHIHYLEFRDNMIYIFVENDIWGFAMDPDEEYRRTLVNRNALWGAKDAGEVDARLHENWGIMMQLINALPRL